MFSLFFVKSDGSVFGMFLCLQTASPTTLGKEMSIFVSRLIKQQKLVSQVQIMGKFAGAVGNYNAHLVSYPEIDWPVIAETFVKSLGVHFNSHVTQVNFVLIM